MRAFLFLPLLLFCAGCTNRYGDDPRNRGLPSPADTPVPIATPAEKQASLDQAGGYSSSKMPMARMPLAEI